MTGGAERLWEGIVRHLNLETPHRADLIAVDTPELTFGEVVTSYARFDELDLDAYDLVITGKYPAWMIRHRRHVVYMCHRLRGLYDTYAGPMTIDASRLSPPGRRLHGLLDSLGPGRPGARDRVLEAALKVVDDVPADAPDHLFPGPLARRVVQWLDDDALGPGRVSRWLAISETVAGRQGYFPAGVPVEVVVPPAGLEGMAPKATGSGFFTVSRLDVPKRVHLLIEAMRHVEDATATLRIAGTGPEWDSLEQLARGDQRVTLLGGISDEQLIQEYEACRAVPFVPIDEDLGLVTLEAHRAAKPVITCFDSGGVAELVEDEISGLVVAAGAELLSGRRWRGCMRTNASRPSSGTAAINERQPGRGRRCSSRSSVHPTTATDAWSRTPSPSRGAEHLSRRARPSRRPGPRSPSAHRAGSARGRRAAVLRYRDASR